MAGISEHHGQMSVAEAARDAEFARNLKRAQAQNQKRESQKERHIEQLAGEIKSGQYRAPQKTDAQKKQALRSRQGLHAQVLKSRRRKKARAKALGKLEKVVRRYERTNWTLLYVAAIADALFDLLTVPILSTALSFCTTLYINAALWRLGRESVRAKRRMIRVGVSALDLVPIINLIPFSVLIVYRTQEEERKRAEKAKNKLKKLSKI